MRNAPQPPRRAGRPAAALIALAAAVAAGCNEAGVGSIEPPPPGLESPRAAAPPATAGKSAKTAAPLMPRGPQAAEALRAKTQKE